MRTKPIVIALVLLLVLALIAGAVIFGRYMGIRPNEAKAELETILAGTVGEALCEGGSPRSGFDDIDPWYQGVYVVDSEQLIVDAARRNGYDLSNNPDLVKAMEPRADGSARFMQAYKDARRLLAKFYTTESYDQLPCAGSLAVPRGKLTLVISLFIPSR